MIRQVHSSRDTEDSSAGGIHGPASHTGDPARPEESLAETWQKLFGPVRKEFARLKEYVGYYFSVQADRMTLKVRTGAIYGILAIFAGMVGLAAVIMATVLLLQGIVGGLAVLMGGRVWAAQLVTGVAILALAVAAVYFGVRSVTGASLARTMKKYEQRRKAEHAEFGRDVHEATERRPPV